MQATHRSLLCSLLLLAGCNGLILDPDAEDPRELGGGGRFDRELGADDETCEAPAQEAGSKLPRLSTTQLGNTVRDLLSLDVPGVTADFASEGGDSGFDRGDNLAVTIENGFAEDTQAMAEALAERAVNESFDALVPCDAGEGNCREQTVRHLGMRAFRRPLTDEESAQLTTLFDAGAGFYPAMEAFRAGTRVVLEALLQMPDFLYRVELSDDAEVTGYALASRLSYALWNSLPDDALFTAAETGLEDETVLRAEVERMLDDDRARPMVYDFHAQWLEHDRFDAVQRSAARYPEFADVGAADLRAELRRTLDATVFERPTNFATFFAGRTTYVNDALAPLYGLDATGGGMRQVDLSGTGRAGLLTQIGFLSSRADEEHTNLPNRGAFVVRRVLCRRLSPPPDDIDLSLPELGTEVRTQRERFEVGTANAPCSGCHAEINPFGFAFESFDSAGRFRTEDHGYPIDTSSEITLDGETVRFDDAEALIDRLAASHEARSCYATHWVRYLYARPESEADRCLIEDAADRLEDPEYTVRDLVRDLVTAAPARLRGAEASP